MFSEQAVDYRIGCSFSSCHESEDYNNAVISTKANDWQKQRLSGENVSCYINPYRPSQVIMMTVSRDLVLHSIIWPSLILGIIFLILVLRRFYHCWHLANQIRNKSDQDEQQQQQNNRRTTNKRHSESSGEPVPNPSRDPWTAPQNTCDNDDFIAHLERELEGPSVHLEHVSVIDNSKHQAANQQLPKETANGKRKSSVIPPPKQFQTGAVSDESDICNTQDDIVMAKRTSVPKSTAGSQTPRHEESILRKGSVSLVSDGVIKYTNNPTVIRPKSASRSRQDIADKKASSSKPLPAPKQLDVNALGSVGEAEKPTSSKKLPPIRGTPDVQDDGVSNGRLTRKQRAQQYREAKRQERINGRDKIDNIDDEGDVKLKSMLQKMEPVSSTPISTPRELEQIVKSKFSDHIDDPLQDPHLQKNGGENRKDSKTPKSTAPKPIPKAVDRKLPSLATPPQKQSPRGPQRNQRENQRANNMNTSYQMPNSSFHRVPSSSTLSSLNTSKSSNENNAIDKVLKFSRYTSEPEAIRPGSSLKNRISNTDIPGIPSNLNPRGNPLASFSGNNNLNPLKPIPAPRKKLDVNIPSGLPSHPREWEAKSKLANEEIKSEVSGTRVDNSENINTSNKKKMAPQPRPSSRMNFNPEISEVKKRNRPNSSRPKTMYGDFSDSDSLASDQAIPDRNDQYMDSVRNVPAYYDDKHSLRSSQSSFDSRIEHPNGRIPDSSLPPIDGLNLHLLEYVTHSVPDDTARDTNRGETGSWDQGSDMSHLSYSPNSTDNGIGENGIISSVLKTRGGDTIDLPPGATIVPGENGAPSHLTVQDGEEHFVLPIPENAQYIVYEYIEEDSTTTMSRSTFYSDAHELHSSHDDISDDCDDEDGHVCHHCGGERTDSPPQIDDDVIIDEL